MDRLHNFHRSTLLIMFLLLGVGVAKRNKAPASRDQFISEKTSNDENGQVCSSAPCVNGGSCVVTGSDTYKCKCAPYYTGENCIKEPITNVALAPCGANCTVSSSLSPEDNCYTSIDGTTVIDGRYWASDYERVGAWFRVHFTDYYRIHTFAVFDRFFHERSSSSFSLGTSDLRNMTVNLMCLGTSGLDDKFWQQFDLDVTITKYLHIEVTAVCDPASTDVLGFRGILVYGNDVPLKNAASIYAGATCTASSAYHQEDFGCQNAIDEVDTPGVGNEWMSDGEGAGAWIQINLNQTSTVMAVGFLQRCNQTTQNNFLMLEFSDGSSQEVELECFTTGLDPLDCEGQYWQQFDLDPYMVTSYVRVTITAVCTAENNGFREIRVFSLREEGNY